MKYYSRKFAIYLLMILLFASCSDKKKITTFYETTDQKMEAYYVLKKQKEIKHGAYSSYFENGNIQEKSNYKNGALDGERRIFNAEGKLIITEHHSNGNYEGLYKSYFPDGTIESEGLYRENKMTGTWKFYYQDPPGQIKEAVTFKNNIENGPFIEYHENGIMAAEGVYVDEQQHGEVKVYTKKGELHKRILYEMDRVMKYEEFN